MRITAKGQVTIPIEIREQLGLLPHTHVQFEVEGDAVRIRKARDQGQGRGERLVERMWGRAGVAMTTAEIMSLTRGDT